MTEEALDLATLEPRMAAVRAVRQVVATIWALSRAQLPLVERALADAGAYVDWLDAVVDKIAGPPRPAPEGSALHLVLGPERAYCGALPKQLLDQLPRAGAIGLVGRRLAEAAAQDPQLKARLVFAVPGPSTHEDAEPVAEGIATSLLDHVSRERIELWYPRRETSRLSSALLIGARELPRSSIIDRYSALPDVLRAALHEALAGRLMVGLIETLLVEVRTRMQTAEQARAASDRKLEELQQAWKIARQQQITTELLEVVAGHRASLAEDHR